MNADISAKRKFKRGGISEVRKNAIKCHVKHTDQPVLIT